MGKGRCLGYQMNQKTNAKKGDNSMLNFNDQGEIEINCSNQISDHGFSDDNEFSQTQESMSEQFI